jgi:hypothetical protein
VKGIIEGKTRALFPLVHEAEWTSLHPKSPLWEKHTGKANPWLTDSKELGLCWKVASWLEGEWRLSGEGTRCARYSERTPIQKRPHQHHVCLWNIQPAKVTLDRRSRSSLFCRGRLCVYPGAQPHALRGLWSPKPLKPALGWGRLLQIHLN